VLDDLQLDQPSDNERDPNEGQPGQQVHASCR